MAQTHETQFKKPTGRLTVLGFTGTAVMLLGSSGRDASAQQLVEMKHSAATESLIEFQFPDERELRDELGLTANDQFDLHYAKMRRALMGEMNISEKEKLVTACAAFNPQDEDFKLYLHEIACIPVWFETNQRVKSNSSVVTLEKLSEQRPVVYGQVHTKETWKHLRDKDFKATFPAVNPQTTASLDTLHAAANETKHDCRYANAMASLMVRAEVFLPQSRAYKTIFDLYPYYSNCATPDDEAFELVHRKTGLIYLQRGNILQAKQSLEKALLAKNPKEKFRSLFWLGFLKSQENLDKKENAYWRTLQKEYPLSFHTIIASHAMNEDPMDTFVEPDSKEIKLHRRSENRWTEFSLAALVFDAFASKQDDVAFARWSRVIGPTLEGPNPQANLYLAMCHNNAQNYLHSFRILAAYLRDSTGTRANLDLLKLIFPTPFSKEILNASNVIDPLVVLGLVRQESAFDTRSRSRADARGLMQLLHTTAKRIERISPQELHEPETNLRIGHRYLQTLLQRYGGKIEYALAAYNAGAANLDKWVQRFPQTNTLLFADLMPFLETRNYVAIILRNAYWYGRIFSYDNSELSKKFVAASGSAAFRAETVSHLLQIALAEGKSLKSNAVANFLKNVPNKPEITTTSGHANGK